MNLSDLKTGGIYRFVPHGGDTFFKILDILAETVIVMMVSMKMERADVQILDLTYTNYVEAMVPATDADIEEINSMLLTARYHNFGEYYAIKAECE